MSDDNDGLTAAAPYRGALYLELQKLGRDANPNATAVFSQLGLGETPPEPVEGPTGLDLTVAEDRALSAIQYLLDKTDYKGNLEPAFVKSQDHKWEGNLPRLKLTWEEYLEAYGLEKGPSGTFSRAQRDEAVKALHSLMEPRRIVYKRRRREKGKVVFDAIKVYKPLIGLALGYKGLSEAELEELEAGQELPERVTALVIEAGPLLMDMMESFYLLKPPTLHNDIKELWAGRKRRIPRAYSLFIEYLLTLNHSPNKIHRDKLAQKLRLDSYIQNRRQSDIDKVLEECLWTAQELGYLLDHKEEFLVYTLWLNPEFCRRIGQETPEDEADGTS